MWHTVGIQEIFDGKIERRRKGGVKEYRNSGENNIIV